MHVIAFGSVWNWRISTTTLNLREKMLETENTHKCSIGITQIMVQNNYFTYLSFLIRESAKYTNLDHSRSVSQGPKKYLEYCGENFGMKI